MQANRVRARNGCVQESGSRKASRETRVQSSPGRGSWRYVFDSWQVCGGMKVGFFLLPRMECVSSSGGATTSDGCQPMTQQGQRVCFEPDRAFANKIHIGRVILCESTPVGGPISERRSNLNVEVGTKLERYRCGGAEPTQDDGHREAHGIDSCRSIRLLVQLLGLDMFRRTVHDCECSCKPRGLFAWLDRQSSKRWWSVVTGPTKPKVAAIT